MLTKSMKKMLGHILAILTGMAKLALTFFWIERWKKLVNVEKRSPENMFAVEIL
jgi:hypothetical protein